MAYVSGLEKLRQDEERKNFEKCIDINRMVYSMNTEEKVKTQEDITQLTKDIDAILDKIGRDWQPRYPDDTF